MTPIAQSQAQCGEPAFAPLGRRFHTLSLEFSPLDLGAMLCNYLDAVCGVQRKP